MDFEALFRMVKSVLPTDSRIYLVGGCVRDRLLARPVHDLDFVMAGNTRQVARQVAAGLGASYFLLDDERNMARVIFEPQGGGQRYTLDFVAMEKGDLETDLRKRDFTINAMAIDVQKPEITIDPTGGAGDLRTKVLRACSATAMEDDPLRVLRAFRIANQLQLRIEPETLTLLRKAAPRLSGVSGERRRDELFKILSGERPTAAIQAMQTSSVLPYILPELQALPGCRQSPPHIFDVWEHTLAVVKHLDELLTLLGNEFDPDDAGNLTKSVAVLQLGRFRQKINSHLKTFLNPERTLPSLLLLAALYHDAGKPATAQVEEQGGRIRNFGHEELGARWMEARGRALYLSNEEIERLVVVVRHHMRIHLLAQPGTPPSRRAIYRFFKDTGEAGIDICLFSLADLLGTYAHTLPVEIWNGELEIIRTLMEAWWEKPGETVRPLPLVNGKDLMTELKLSPGPLIGRLLEAIREAQAAGQIQTREEALELAARIL